MTTILRVSRDGAECLAAQYNGRNGPYIWAFLEGVLGFCDDFYLKLEKDCSITICYANGEREIAKHNIWIVRSVPEAEDPMYAVHSNGAFRRLYKILGNANAMGI